VRAKIKQEKADRNDDTGQREELMRKVKLARLRNESLKGEIKLYEKCDPKRLERVKKQAKVCEEASTRWTDNLFELMKWIKQNTGMSEEEVC